jgi:hypothetical protein
MGDYHRFGPIRRRPHDVRFALLVVLADTGRRPNGVDLAALMHSPTNFVHNLRPPPPVREVWQAGIHPG